jgi:hypothetical protein
MVIKYTKIYHSKSVKNLPKFGIFGLKTNRLATLFACQRIRCVFQLCRSLICLRAIAFGDVMHAPAHFADGLHMSM